MFPTVADPQNARRRIGQNRTGFPLSAVAKSAWMENPATEVFKLSSRGQNKRKNFGNAAARKRGESNFMRAFERAYFARTKAEGVAAGEFSIAGFGVADLVWIGWARGADPENFTALAVEKQLRRRHLHAFEGKLKDWRRGLQQAFRYRYFADKAIVVMPYESAAAALANLDSFRHSLVGFWTFHAATGTIREHYTPTRVRAFSDEAKQKAIRLLSSKINFRQFGK
jgi:hypothetical protein